MGGLRAFFVLAIAAMLATMGIAVPGLAHEVQGHFAPGSVCHVAADESDTFARLARQPARWNCAASGAQASGRVAIRFDLGNAQAGMATADHLRLARLHFERMDVIAIATDGTSASRTYGRDDLLPGRNLLEAAVRLPALDGDIAAIGLVVEGALSVDRLLKAEPVAGPPVALVAGYDHILAALVCGLLLAPLFFDIGFDRTLGKAFPLVHAAFCALAVLQTASYAGLLLMVTDFALSTHRAISILSFDLMIAVSSLFILTFVEQGIFERHHRIMLWGMAGLTVGLGMIASFALPLLGASTGIIYYGGYVFYLAALAVIVTRALRKRSRAMRFIILAHLPLLIIGGSRVFIGLFAPAGFTLDSFWPQNLALAFEVIVTAFAVADRFMLLKRERDHARSEARVLEELSEQDALTGLLNRRALETRFSLLRAQGFTTLAVLDLDHFKRVNDRRGHTAGDKVLKCVARALESGSDNSLAFRMGGEEFVLLLRGKNALERAENRRAAITEYVSLAGPVPERVTASMGIVEAPHDALSDASFEALYARADRLLYEAKGAGRDRTISERLQVFRPRQKPDRRSAARLPA